MGALYGTSLFIFTFGDGVTVALVFNYMPMMQLGDYFSKLAEKSINKTGTSD